MRRILFLASFLALVSGSSAYAQFGGIHIPKPSLPQAPKLPEVHMPSVGGHHLPLGGANEALKKFGSHHSLTPDVNFHIPHPKVHIDVPKLKEGASKHDPHIEKLVPEKYLPKSSQGGGSNGGGSNGEGRKTEVGGFGTSAIRPVGK